MPSSDCFSNFKSRRGPEIDRRADEILPPNTQFGGRYRIIKHLAAGGMARVYVAEQAPLGREVALKILHREFSEDLDSVKRFEREAIAVSKLTHPNTITVFDFGQAEDGQFYLAMEFLEGEPLSNRLKKVGALAPQDALAIAAQVSRSLAEAHQKGIVHRDLKPDNIFLGQIERNFVKVLDFGIAKLMKSEPVTKLTQMGAIPGTPEYMSPEQARGEELDGRSDLYALGIVLYEMLSGKAPFTAPTFLATALKHLSQPPPPLPRTVPAPLASFIINVALAKSPNDRPATADLFLEGLEEAANSSGIQFGHTFTGRVDRGEVEASLELELLRKQLREAEAQKSELERQRVTDTKRSVEEINFLRSQLSRAEAPAAPSAGHSPRVSPVPGSGPQRVVARVPSSAPPPRASVQERAVAPARRATVQERTQQRAPAHQAQPTAQVTTPAARQSQPAAKISTPAARQPQPVAQVSAPPIRPSQSAMPPVPESRRKRGGTKPDHDAAPLADPRDRYAQPVSVQQEDERLEAPTRLDWGAPEVADLHHQQVLREANAPTEPKPVSQRPIPRNVSTERGYPVQPEAPAQSANPGPRPVESKHQTSIHIPPQNVSSTLMAFAKPAIDAIGVNPNAAQLKQTLVFATSVWNAAIQGAEAVGEARAWVVANGTPTMVQIFDLLYQAKLRQFASESFLIEEIEVTQKVQGLGIIVKVRIP